MQVRIVGGDVGEITLVPETNEGDSLFIQHQKQNIQN